MVKNLNISQEKGFTDTIELGAVQDAALPDPFLNTYYSNLNERVLWLETDVDETSLEISKQIIIWNTEDRGIPCNERKPIKLMIVSYGGELDINNSLIDTIALSKTPIWGINMGYACSAGCFIYMSCHKRLSLPSSYFLLHKGGASFSGTYEQVMAETSHYRNQIDALSLFVLAHSKIDEETFKNNISGEWYISAKEAVAYGFCDSIVTDIEQIL